MKWNEPKWQHDCDKCWFYGKYGDKGKYDAYFCPPVNEDRHSGSLILRYGDEPSQYISSPLSMGFMAKAHPEMLQFFTDLYYEEFLQIVPNFKRIEEVRDLYEMCRV